MRVQPTYTSRFLDENHNELTMEQAKEISVAQDELARFHAMQVTKRLNAMEEEQRASVYNYLVDSGQYVARDQSLVQDQPSFVQSNTL